MSEVVKFLIFYTILLGLLLWFEGEMGSTFFTSATNPSTVYSGISVSFMESLLNTVSAYPLLNIMAFIPFTIALIYVIVCVVRGVSP